MIKLVWVRSTRWKAVREHGHFFGEEHLSLFEIANVAGEALDFGQVVRGEKDGGFRGAIEQAFNELVAYQRIESGEWLVEHDLRVAR